MDLDLAGDVGRPADEAIRRITVVLDGQIAAADLGTARRGPRLTLADGEVTRLYIIGIDGAANRQAASAAPVSLRSMVVMACPFVARYGLLGGLSYRKSNPLAVDRESGDAAARCLICANLSLEQ
jgi:hypothetical protein